LHRNSRLLVALALALCVASCSKIDENALRKEITTPRDGMPMVLVKTLKFDMGSKDGAADEMPVHPVFVRAFYMDKYEVSNKQYRKFLEYVEKHGDDGLRHPLQPKTKSHRPRAWDDDWAQKNMKHYMDDNYPVIGVDWFSAYAYAKWAGKRLPTEAEFERAARGTQNRKFPWGNRPVFEGSIKRANIGIAPDGWPTSSKKNNRDGYLYTCPVTEFPDGQSEDGIFNLAGNVREWCYDFYEMDYYTRSPMYSPKGPAAGREKSCRGGSWGFDESKARSTARFRSHWLRSNYDIGFRCVKDISPDDIEK